MTNQFDLIPILDAFLIPEDCQAIPFGSGYINDTFKIITPEKAFILQRINHEVFKDPVAVMKNIAETGNFLKLQNYPLQVLAPLETSYGLPYFQDSLGNYWRLFPFIQNATSFDEVSEAAVAFKAARAFGDFISGLKDFDAQKLSETIPGFHNGPQRWLDFEKAVQDDLAGRKGEIRELLDSVMALKQLCFLVNYSYINGRMTINTASGATLPVRVVHHDTKINNVVFDQNSGEALCVIDLDTLMPGTVLSDFGDMVRTFVPTFSDAEPDATKIEVRMNIFEAMCRGFMAATSAMLTDIEKKHLLDGGKYITFIQVIRFLGDYLNGDIYYKTRYNTQNLDRTKNQLTLLESILKHEEEMLSMIEAAAEH